MRESNQLEDELVQAVWRQDAEAVKRILEAGANPNLPGHNCPSAIACAGENDETGEIIQLLVEAGADVNLQDTFGQTPLHWAVDVAIDGAVQANAPDIDWSVVAVLLSLEADPNIRDSSGRTAFDFATCYSEHVQESLKEFLHSINYLES